MAIVVLDKSRQGAAQCGAAQQAAATRAAQQKKNAWSSAADPLVMLTMICLASCEEEASLRLFACRMARRATQLAGATGMERPLLELAEGGARARRPQPDPELREAVARLAAAQARGGDDGSPAPQRLARSAALDATRAAAIASPLEAAHASLCDALRCVRITAGAGRRPGDPEIEVIVRDFLRSSAQDLRELVPDPFQRQPPAYAERVHAVAAAIAVGADWASLKRAGLRAAAGM
jgi:hypothetical protein